MRRTITNIIVIIFACLFFQKGVRPEKMGETEAQINAFANLPVKFDGRKKPIDTVARNLLTVLSGKQTVRTENGDKISATQWLLDNLAGHPDAIDYKVIRIESLDVLASFGLKEAKRNGSAIPTENFFQA